ncbi:MAG: hypothetical protein ABIP55_14185 [Tepidisphaeraceae bacterium]
MRRHLLLVAFLALAGCAPFTQAQIDLVTQARRGIAIVSEDDAKRNNSVAELAKLRRQRLDEAFDRDVRERAMTETIDPDWVIEARRAYAVALEAYAKAQASDESNAMERRHILSAIDAALAKLQWLQSIQLKFDLTSDNREEKP